MRFWRSIKNHLFPHWGNAHRPHILRRQWLLALLAVIVMCEAAILAASAVHQGPSVFLAAVVRSEVISYTDEARMGEGGQTLQENELLDAAAQAKADDMAQRGYFSHTGPDGETPWTWVARVGYDYVFAGENLAVRFNDSKDVVDAWMASPTHRANILKPQYQDIGVGLAEGTYKGGPATFVVQFFASPSLAPATTPAVSTLPPAEASVAGAQTSPAPAEPAADAPAPAPESSLQSTLRDIGAVFSDARPGASGVLWGVAILLMVVLALTFFIRIQVQPTDLLLPGLAVALIAISLVGANATFLPASQSASAVLSQGGDIEQGLSVERVRVTFPQAQDR